MQYKSVQESDGTYTIRQSINGLNWEIIKTGVRGCNVNRVLNSLYTKDLQNTQSQIQGGGSGFSGLQYAGKNISSQKQYTPPQQDHKRY